MAKLALDTNAVSALLRSDTELAHIIDAFDGEIVLPVVVYGELLYGFRGGNRYSQNVRELRQMIQTLQIKTLPVGEQACKQYADIFFSLKTAGTPIPINDIWIAASCQAYGCVLITRDRDFQNISSLVVKTW